MSRSRKISVDFIDIFSIRQSEKRQFLIVVLKGEAYITEARYFFICTTHQSL